MIPCRSPAMTTSQSFSTQIRHPTLQSKSGLVKNTIFCNLLFTCPHTNKKQESFSVVPKATPDLCHTLYCKVKGTLSLSKGPYLELNKPEGLTGRNCRGYFSSNYGSLSCPPCKSKIKWSRKMCHWSDLAKLATAEKNMTPVGTTQVGRMSLAWGTEKWTRTKTQAKGIDMFWTT